MRALSFAVGFTLVVGAAFLAPQCHAEGITAIDVPFASWHSVARPGGQWCQTNPGLLVESGRWVVGGYHSSLCSPVWMAGYVQPVVQAGKLHVGILGAVDKGYNSPIVGAIAFSYGNAAGIIGPEVVNERLVGFEMGFILRFQLGK